MRFMSFLSDSWRRVTLFLLFFYCTCLWACSRMLASQRERQVATLHLRLRWTFAPDDIIIECKFILSKSCARKSNTLWKFKPIKTFLIASAILFAGEKKKTSARKHRIHCLVQPLFDFIELSRGWSGKWVPLRGAPMIDSKAAMWKRALAHKHLTLITFA